MSRIKSLLKESLIYGGSTIASKMMSWLLTILFTYTLKKSDFGIMTNLYAYAALAIVILTFGMETGFFRFVNQTDKYEASTVYSTTLMSVGGIILIFLTCFWLFPPFIRMYLWSREIPDVCIRMVIVILSLDAFSAIPFAFLRHKKKAVKFCVLKILNVVFYTLLCLFFLIICPKINRYHPSWIAWFWISSFKLEYVFIANLIATSVETLCLLPELTGFKYRFDGFLAIKMFRYCLPLVFMGLVGIGNQVIDKLIFPLFYSGRSPMFDELGIYSACFKIALIMMMFTQAFRYAYEPFFFKKSKEKDAKQSYADIMKYFIILGLLVFLSIVFYLDILKYMIAPAYFGALKIIPIVLLGDLFFAVYFNLSVWYKLVDRTYWGAVFSTISFIVLATINIVFIPKISYWACAWAGFAGDGLIMFLSYFIGQKYYPIQYDIKSIGFYILLTLILYSASYFVHFHHICLRLLFNTVLISIYLIIMLRKEFPQKRLPCIRHLM